MTTQPIDPMITPDPNGKLPFVIWQGHRVARCQATSRSGNQCGHRASPGQRVCHLHGAASPQAQRKAKLRLAELVSPAIATLAKEMTQADTSADRMKAANSILDRAGWGRVQKVEAHDAREILLQRLLDMREDQLEDHDQVAKEIAPHIAIEQMVVQDQENEQ